MSQDQETYTEDEIREALSKAEAEASNHGANYAAGMRLTRTIVEQDLLGGGWDDDSE